MVKSTKNKKSSKKNSSEDKESKVIKVRQIAKNLTEVNIGDYCTELMLPFGKTVNLARAVPDLRDGLKPVGRRILWTLFYIEKLKPGSPNIKCGKLVGDVMGTYHPHGDTAIYDATTSLGLYFKYYPLLVKPASAFGDMYGSGAAAMRYTEVSMAKFAWDCFFSDWSDQTTDFKLNYSNTVYEPEYLPSKFPTGLIIPSTNMGWALYAGIPPYNLIEVADLTMKLIDNPKYKKCTLIPDFPMPCDIVDTDFNKLSEKGEGKFRLRAHIEEDEDGDLVITSLPYQVMWNPVQEQIIKLKNNANKLDGVDNIIDLSTGKEELDLRIKLVLKKGADKEKIKEVLFKSTSLEITFVYNMEYTNDYENVHYNIKSYLLDWIDYRIETKRRFLLSEYTRLNKEFHMLKTIIGILSKKNSDKKVMELMRSSESKAEITKRLIKEFDLTDLQADVISGFSLSQFSKKSLSSYKERYEEIEPQLKHIKSLLDDESKIVDSIKDELKEFKKKYGRPRRCNLIQVDDKSKVPNTDHIIVITKKGFIKKLPFDQEDIGTLEQGDKVVSKLEVNNLESILIFSETGKVYSLKVSDIISVPIDSIGLDISNLIKVDSKVVGMVKKPTDKENKESVIFVTRSGLVKKTELGNFNGCTRNGLIGILLKEDASGEMDKLVDVLLLKRNKDLIIYTNNGKALRFNSKEIPVTLRSSSGVIGMRMEKDDEVNGIIEIDKKKKYLAILTSSGNAKKCLIDNFEKSSRAKAGITLIGGLGAKEKIVGILSVNDDDTITVSLNSRMDEYNVSDFKEATKLAKGKKLVACKNNEHIISIY